MVEVDPRPVQPSWPSAQATEVTSTPIMACGPIWTVVLALPA